MFSRITIILLLLLISSVSVVVGQPNTPISENGTVKMTIVYDRPVITKNDGLQAHYTHEITSRGIRTKWKLTSCSQSSWDDLSQQDKDSLRTTQVTVEEGTVLVRSTMNMSYGCTDLNFTADLGTRFRIGTNSTVIEIQNGTAQFVITPEYQTCSYLMCNSIISVENLENFTVTFPAADISVVAEKEVNTYVEVLNIMVPKLVNNVTLDSDNETILSQNTYYRSIVTRRDVSVNDTINVLPGKTALFVVTTEFATPQNTFKYNVSLRYQNVDYLIDPFFTTTSTNFNQGTFQSTLLNASGFVQLTPPNLQGRYISEIFDAETTANWTNITWFQEFNYGKQTPDFLLTDDGDFVTPLNTSGLQILYHFNNDSTENNSFVRDWTNNLENMSCESGQCPTLVSDGIYNKSYSFDGVNDHFETINFTTTDFGTSSFTMMAWINTTSSGNRRIISKRAAGTGAQLEQRVGGTIRFLIDEQTAPSIFVDGLTSIDDGQWHHIVGVRDTENALIRIYVDGREDAVPMDEGTIGNISNFLQLSVGARDNGVNAFGGQIDEVLVYNVVKSQEEIREHYVRGIVFLNISARSCADSLCVNDSFVTLDGDSTIKLNLTDSVQFFQYSFNFSTLDAQYSPFLFNVTIGFETEFRETLRIGVCPSGIAEVLLFWMVVFISFAFMYLGFKSPGPIIGILGSSMLIISSLIFTGCSAIVGFILTLVAIILLTSYVVIIWQRFNQNG